MADSNSLPPAVKLPVTGLLAWILPGMGHIFIGDRNRGIVILVTIAVTFWGGVAIGGVRTTVDPARKKLWFVAQISSGGHAIAAYLFGNQSRKGLSPQQLAHSRWNSAEVATVYTGVAGLLSVLAILDALVRADAPRRRQDKPARSRPPTRAT